MPRLDLATRATRIQQRIRGRDLTGQLPGGVRTDIDRFARAIGVTPERFVSWSPSTRARYISAAKKGRTVAQERARQREQRKARLRPYGVTRQTKRQQIESIADRLVTVWGLDTTKGPDTHVDDIASQVMLSETGINDHISVYGETYVLEHLKVMLDSVESAPHVGRERWNVFKASPSYADEDERWYWYHSSPVYYGHNAPNAWAMP